MQNYKSLIVGLSCRNKTISQDLKDRYERCDFSYITVDEGVSLSGTFTECVFHGADLSGALFLETIFKNCTLTSSDLSRVLFRNVVFDNCTLDCLELKGSSSLDRISIWGDTKISRLIGATEVIEGSKRTLRECPTGPLLLPPASEEKEVPYFYEEEEDEHYYARYGYNNWRDYNRKDKKAHLIV